MRIVVLGRYKIGLGRCSTDFVIVVPGRYNTDRGKWNFGKVILGKYGTGEDDT